MRKAVTIAIAMLCAVACRMADTGSRTAVQSIALTDSLLAAGGISDTLKMGRLHAGEVALKSFALQNLTQTPLVIIRYENSCGCTSFIYDRKPVMPGQQTVIECRFDSSGTFGWQMKPAKFHIAGIAEPLRIIVEAEVD